MTPRSGVRRWLALVGLTSTLALVAGAGLPAASGAAVPTRNKAPRVVVHVGTPHESTGRVRVRLEATDSDSARLRIRVPDTTLRGRIVTRILKAGSTQAAFTYTPNAAARHAAAADNAPASAASDMFTVRVFDGEGGRTSTPIAVAISPANSVPTGTSTVGTPNPATGVVTGSIDCADDDDDALTFSSSTPSKGSVLLSSSGSFTYTPTAAARTAAGLPGATVADHTDSFTVTVSDGYGGTLQVPVTVPVDPQ